jgi:lipoyl(octanoyl) transferase
VTRTLRGLYLGRRRYEPILALQEALHARRVAKTLGDTVLLLEHEPVITLGRGAHAEHLLVSQAALAQRGVDFVKTGRGGDITLHAPGQLVAYPIFDLQPDRADVRRYVKDLARVMQTLARSLGVESGLHPDHVGLWADAALPSTFTSHQAAGELVKIGAIGVRISRWVTMHGFALNLAPDLDLFRMIVPCGIREYGVASVQSLGGGTIAMESAAERAFAAFRDVFDAAPSELEHCAGDDWARVFPTVSVPEPALADAGT